MLLTCLLSAPLFFGIAVPADVPVALRLKPGASVPQFPAGTSAKRLGDGTVQLSLKAQPGLGARLNALRALPGVDAVEYRPEFVLKLGLERNSVAAVDEYIRAKRALHKKLNPDAEDEREEANPRMEDEAKGAGVDFLEAYKYFIQQRAYPNDSVDWNRWGIAARHIAGMTRGEVRSGAPGLPPNPTWEFVGPKDLDAPYRTYYGVRPTTGRVNALAYSPSDPNTYYFGAAGGGLLKSTDAGVTWQALTDTALPVLPVSSVAVNPANSNQVWLGSGDGHGYGGYSDGLWKSEDAGATWAKVPLPYEPGISSSINAITIDPDNPNIIMVAPGIVPTFYNRIYRSTDGGATWNAPAGLPEAGWSHLAYSEKRADGTRTVYASGYKIDGGFYRSNDSGATWTAMSSPVTGDSGPQALAVSKLNADTVYVLDTAGNRVFKSTNAGVSWTNITSGIDTGYNWSQSWYDYAINTSTYGTGADAKDLILVQLIDVSMSRDGGATWRSIGGPTYSGVADTHNDQHCAAVNPSNPNEWLIGNDGGVYRWTINPSSGTWTWNGLSKTTGITQFYTGAWHPTNPSIMIGGTQDNASPASYGNLERWENPGAGDGCGTDINQVNPLIQYTSSQFNGIVRTTDGWTSSAYIAPDWGGDNVPFIGKLTADPNNARYMYAGTNYLWRWDETTQSWTPRLGAQNMDPGGSVNAIEIAKGDSQRIYTGTSGGSVFCTSDGGTTWRKINAGLPLRYVTWISSNPSNPKDILVTLSGTGSGHVFRCQNTDAASIVWTDVSGVGGSALPDLPANTVARDPWTPGTWYVGTDLGAYKTTDNGLSWTNFGAPLGLPNVVVNALKTNAATGYLNAATFGRGMWRLKIRSPRASSLASVAINALQVDAGGRADATVALEEVADANTSVTLVATNGLSAPEVVVVPGGRKAITFRVQAGLVQQAATARLQAQLEGVEKTATITINPTRRSAFIGQSGIPTRIATNGKFRASVTFENNGSVTWTQANGTELQAINPVNNVRWGVRRVPLAAGDAILNRQRKTFLIDAVAPEGTGTYDFTWQLKQAGQGLIGLPSTSVAIEVYRPDKDAVFVSQSVPNSVRAGADFSVSMTFKNVGRLPWTRATGFKLTSQNPANNAYWGTTYKGLEPTDQIGLNQTKTFTFTAKAPTAAGYYNFQWQMFGAGFFGQRSTNIQLRVKP